MAQNSAVLGRTLVPTISVRQQARLGKRLGLTQGDALVVTDVQRDFLPGGSLAVAGADEIIPRLNAYIASFDARHLPIFFTRDWHPSEHCSFVAAGGPWPPHCVQGTPGAAWPENLNIVRGARIVSKAMDKNVEAYSGFGSGALLTLLRDLDVRRVFIAGLTTDYCVRETVLDARSYGFDVVVLADAIRGINAQPGDETRAIREMMEHGATLFQSSRARRTGGTAKRRPPTQERPVSAYGFGKTVTLPFGETLDRVTQALASEGFGVLSDIDVAGTLKKKLDTDMPPYRILGACNPPLAQRALEAEPEIGLLLPCNVVVRQTAEESVRVEFLDPNVLASLTDEPRVAGLAGEVRERLMRVMAAV